MQKNLITQNLKGQIKFLSVSYNEYFTCLASQCSLMLKLMLILYSVLSPCLEGGAQPSTTQGFNPPDNIAVVLSGVL